MSTLVTIPDCTATQLIHGASILLAGGPLDLLQNAEDRTLTIKLGEFAFPLSKTTSFFTHAENPLWYFFKAPTIDESFVRITLPKEVTVDGSEPEKLRDRFEAVLEEAGLLKTGVEAAGDELGAGAKEEAAKLTAMIRSQVASHVGSHLPTSQPKTFSPSTHSAADKAATGTATVAGYAATAAGAFAKATISLGETIVSVVNTATRGPVDERQKLREDLAEAGYDVEDDKPPTFTDDVKQAYNENLKPAVNAGKDAATGVGHGVASVAGEARSGAYDVVKNDYGNDAAALSTKAGQATDNSGAAVKSVAVDTSAIKIAADQPGQENKSAEVKTTASDELKV